MEVDAGTLEALEVSGGSCSNLRGRVDSVSAPEVSGGGVTGLRGRVTGGLPHLDLDETLDADYWGDAQNAIPASSAACVAQGWAAPTALWLLDEASSPHVDKVGSVQGIGSSVYSNREFSGIKHGGSLYGKVGVEGRQDVAASCVYVSNTNLFQVGYSDFSFSLLVKSPTAYHTGDGYQIFCGKGLRPWISLGWVLQNSAPTNIILYIWDGGGGSGWQSFTVPNYYDGGIHLITYAMDRDYRSYLYLDDQATQWVSAVQPGNISSSAYFCVTGDSSGWRIAFDGQTAWHYLHIGTCISRDGHDALYQALFPWRTEYATHARNGRVIVPISSSRVATYGPGQPAHAYDAAAAGVGLAAIKPLSFLGINSKDVTAWSVSNATKSTIDGPSGQKDAIRVVDASGTQTGYAYSGNATVSVTHAAHTFGFRCKQGGVGTKAQVQVYFSGSPSGPEWLVVKDVASVPASWTEYYGTVTPAYDNHTAAMLCFMPTDGVPASTGTVDFAEPWGYKGSDPVPAYIDVAAGAAEAIAAQSVTVTNDGTKFYASRGKVVAELQNLNTILGKHVAVWAESSQASPYIEMGLDGDDAYITIRDSSRTLVATVTAAGAVDASAHEVTWLWDSAQPVYGLQHIAILVDGVMVAADRTSSWTPPADSALTPLGVAGGNSSNELHGAFSRLAFLDPRDALRAMETSGGGASGIRGRVAEEHSYIYVPRSSDEAVALGWSPPTAMWLLDEATGNFANRIVGGASLVPDSRILHHQDFPDLLGKTCAKGTYPGWPPGWAYVPSAPTYDIGAVSFTVSYLIAPSTEDVGVTNEIGGKVAWSSGSYGFSIFHQTTGGTLLYLRDPTGDDWSCGGPTLPKDGHAHLLTVQRDVGAGKYRFFLDDEATVEGNCSKIGTLSNSAFYSLFNTASLTYTCRAWIGWHLLNIGVAEGRAAHDATWALINSPTEVDNFSAAEVSDAEAAGLRGRLSSASEVTLLDLDERLTAPYWEDSQSIIPSTSQACLDQGWAAPTELWMCDETSGNVVGEIAGWSLAPQSGVVLGRDFHGIKHGGSLWGKKSVETRFGGYGLLGDGSYCEVDTSDFSIAFLVRSRSYLVEQTWHINKYNYSSQRGWLIRHESWNRINIPMQGATGGLKYHYLDNCFLWGGGIHLLTFSFDRDGNISLFCDDRTTVTYPCQVQSSLSSGYGVGMCFSSYHWAYAWEGQTAWIYWCNHTAVSRDGHDELYSRILPWREEYATHTRNGRIFVPIGPNRTTVIQAGGPCHAYDSSSGLVGLFSMKPTSFLGLNTRSITLWTGTNASKDDASGPDNIYEAINILLTAAGGYFTSGSATLTGSTNVPFRFGLYAKRSSAGMELRVTVVFSGDPLGSETFTDIISSDSVPTDWTRFSGTCTPTRSAHTSVIMRVGCATNGYRVQVGEAWGIKNATLDPPGWILTGTGAEESTAAQSVTVTNDGTKLLASRGEVTADLQNLDTVLGKHAALWAESSQASPYLEMGLDGDDAYITVRDSSRSLVATVTAAGAVTASAHQVVWRWNALAPVSGDEYYISITVDDVEVALGRTSPWTPSADSALTPVGVAGGNSSNELHGAFSRVQVTNGSFLSDQLRASELSDASGVGLRGRTSGLLTAPEVGNASATGQRGRSVVLIAPEVSNCRILIRGPFVESAVPSGPDTIDVRFSTRMEDNADLRDPESYSFTGGLEVRHVVVISAREVRLYVSPDMATDQQYLLTIYTPE